MVDVRIRAEVRDDLRNLGSNALRLEAFKFLQDLERAPLFGEKLGEHQEVGNLADCRKIYFDKARHRIVYRVIPDEANPVAVDVIVIGPREGLEVYTEAIRRLGRLVDEEP